MQPTQRPALRLLIGAAVLAIAVIAGYKGYAKLSEFFAEVPEGLERTVRFTQPYGGFLPPPTTAANSDSGENSGTGGGIGAVGDVAVAKSKEITRSLKRVITRPEPPITASPGPVPLQPAPAAASPLPETRSGESSPTQSPEQQACTQGMSALGLCELEQAAALKTQREAEEARKARDKQEQTRQQGCNAATAALGLCPS